MRQYSGKSDTFIERRRRRRGTSDVIYVCMKERPHITPISFLIHIFLAYQRSLIACFCYFNTCVQVSNLPFTIKKLFRNVQLKTKKWKLWKAGVCQAMTEDVNGA
jgi:hypothetical protein